MPETVVTTSGEKPREQIGSYTHGGEPALNVSFIYLVPDATAPNIESEVPNQENDVLQKEENTSTEDKQAKKGGYNQEWYN